MIADLNTYDASAAAIARKANAIVISVDYPLAPNTNSQPLMTKPSRRTNTS